MMKAQGHTEGDDMIESLNGIYETVNYKQSTSIKLYENDDFEDYPPHWHTTPEIIMPTENSYTVECYNETFRLKEGDIIFICPGCVHSLYAPKDGGKRIIFQADIIPLRFMKKTETILSLISPLVVITPEEYPDVYEKVKDLLFEICEEYNGNDSFSEFAIYGKLLEIFKLIGSSRANYETDKKIIGRDKKQDNYIEKFIGICDYISQHFTEELTLEDIADRSGFSKYYFSKLFKQFTNMSFYKYVSQKRIEKASELLIVPDLSVTTIALNCGFDSLSSFIRMFKLFKGCTPTEFRSMYSHGEL